MLMNLPGSKPIGHWLRLGALAILLIAVRHPSSHAQTEAETLEYKVKAAFLCKFASYVEWPARAFSREDSPLIIGAMANDSIADELVRTSAGQSANGRPLIVRRLRRGDSIDNVHLVYIASSEERRAADAVGALKGQPVLVVTESSQSVALGSMINFVVVNDKVRFDISPRVAEQSDLKVSSRLLSVARSVTGRAP